jgi:MSHA biogenesis protein MshI
MPASAWLGLHDWLRRNGVRTSAPLAGVGVQFGPRHVRIARVLPQPGGRPRVEFVEVIAAEPLRRADALRWAAQAGALRYAFITLVLSAGEYDLHQMPAPVVAADELRDAVRWQLRSVLPYSPDEAAVDFVRVPHPAEHATRPMLIAVAARRALLEEAARSFDAAGIELDAVDVPDFAQRNLGVLRAGAEGSHAWLSFEGETCLLTVQLGDELAFARRIQLPTLRSATDVIDLDAEAALPSIDERIANQVQRSLDLFERQSGLPAVLQMHVAPHPQAPLIARALADRTGIDTVVFDPREALDFSPTTRTEALPDVFFALGAALRRDAGAGQTQMARPRWLHAWRKAA